MAPPSLTYRTAGAWGAGKGSRLTPGEVDLNFWNVIQWVATEIAALPTANGIANITFSDNVLNIYLDDGTHFGPFNIQTDSMSWMGEWQPSTAYAVNDVVTVAGSGLYLVRVAHTSPASFDPLHGPNYYGKMLSAADAGGGGSGGGIIYIWDDTLSAPEPSPWIGDYWLVKPTGTGAWSGHNNDIAYWDGTAWQFIEPTDGMVIFGEFDGKTYPWFKVWAEGAWAPLGNYIKEMQGLYYLSAGFGGWNADDSLPVFLTVNAMRVSHGGGYTGGTGNLKVEWSRQNSSKSLYHEFHDGYVANTRLGKAASSTDFTLDIYNTVGADWRNAITIKDQDGFVKFRSVTYSQLPAAGAAYEGFRCFVTDATVNTFGATISAGGGSYKVPAWCDGTNWLVG